jgi:DnaJ-class molecular chaperone
MRAVADRMAERVECPICAGRGTTRGRAFSGEGSPRYRCGLCEGAGSVSRSRIAAIPRLRDQMQRVADLMQVGDADAAAEAFRVAVRIARPMMAARE